jgi:hypothetical protein
MAQVFKGGQGGCRQVTPVLRHVRWQGRSSGAGHALGIAAVAGAGE